MPLPADLGPPTRPPGRGRRASGSDPGAPPPAMAAVMGDEGVRPTQPLLDVDESQDIKAFYHNTAYKTSRVHINLEKMKVGRWRGRGRRRGGAPPAAIQPGPLRPTSTRSPHPSAALPAADPQGPPVRLRARRGRQLRRQVRSCEWAGRGEGGGGGGGSGNVAWTCARQHTGGAGAGGLHQQRQRAMLRAPACT